MNDKIASPPKGQTPLGISSQENELALASSQQSGNRTDDTEGPRQAIAGPTDTDTAQRLIDVVS
jgi:hypothetical protein